MRYQLFPSLFTSDSLEIGIKTFFWTNLFKYKKPGTTGLSQQLLNILLFVDKSHKQQVKSNYPHDPVMNMINVKLRLMID